MTSFDDINQSSDQVISGRKSQTDIPAHTYATHCNTHWFTSNTYQETVSNAVLGRHIHPATHTHTCSNTEISYGPYLYLMAHISYNTPIYLKWDLCETPIATSQQMQHVDTCSMLTDVACWHMRHVNTSNMLTHPRDTHYNILTHPIQLDRKKPPPQGAFLMFPDQEPGGRGPPLNNQPQNWLILGVVIQGGSSSSGFLIREHSR